MTISERLAGYVLSLTPESLDEKVKEIARLHFLDGMACMFLGSGGDSVKTALPYVRAHTEGGELLFPAGDGIRTDPKHWAMLGAMAAHSNDFDDMSASLNGHPTALLVPVVLALGQKYRLDGGRVLAAYIAGMEVDSILGQAFARFGYRKGWNTTNVLGIFGAVAAAGSLMGLSGAELSAAFCIAVNEASGFKANFGTMSKDLAIGMTAMKAITCAECAKLGFDASPDAFEGPFGFFRSISGDCDADYVLRLIEEHESEFTHPGIVVKPYPSCRGNHSGIDCITKIVSEHKFTADDVRKVICRCDRQAYDTDRYENPKNPAQAKFSLAFCIAKVVQYGNVCINDFVGDEIKDRSPLAFIPKVEIQCTPELFEYSRFGSEIEVLLNDGTRYVEKECFAKGDPLLPMTREEIWEKLRDCLRYPFGSKADHVVSVLSGFDKASDISTVLESLVDERKQVS